MDAALLKSLETQKNQIHASNNAIRDQREELNDQISSIRRSIDALMRNEKSLAAVYNDNQNKIQDINRKIKEATEEDKDLIVSEHAMLRYVERVIGINRDEMVEKVLPKELMSSAKSLKNGTMAINNSHRIRVRDGVVVTVVSLDREDPD